MGLQASMHGLDLVAVAHESANLAAQKVNHCCRCARLHSQQDRRPACCRHRRLQHHLVNCCACALAVNTEQRAKLVSQRGGALGTQQHLDSFFRACGYLLSSRLSTPMRPLQITSSSTVCPGGYSSVCKEAVCKGAQLRFSTAGGCHALLPDHANACSDTSTHQDRCKLQWRILVPLGASRLGLV